MKLCGVVVWYNPTEEELSNIKSYINYVEKLIVIDNSSKNNFNIFKDFNKIEYIPNMNNLGIAKALNQGCKLAITYGYEWILTMDQDSKFEGEELKKYIKWSEQKIKENPKIVMLSPNVKEEDLSEYVNRVITSGNILNLEAYESVGGFDNELFIDEVDFDMCFKLIEKGYKIYKFKDVRLTHKLGDKKELTFFNKKIESMNHNKVRKYYIVRNRLVVRDRYPEYTKAYNKANIRDFMKVILIEEDKIDKIKYMIKGYKDYRKGILGKLNEDRRIFKNN